MLETTAKTLQCPNYLPNLCVGSACMAWVWDDSDIIRWTVIKGTTEAAMLPTATAGASATVKRPEDAAAVLWTYETSNSKYDVWSHTPAGGLDGHCAITEGR